MCGALRDLVVFVQFKKREKHPWRSVNFSTKINTPPWVFFTFLKLLPNRSTHHMYPTVLFRCVNMPQQPLPFKSLHFLKNNRYRSEPG